MSTKRRRGLGSIVLAAVGLTLPIILASSAAQDPTPATFRTTARFAVDRTVLALSSAVATIEPRLNAPGYRWLRVYFYAFPLTPADVAEATRGSVASLERRWQSKADHPAEYNVSNAVLQFGVDKDGRVWQVDLSIPGHGCTIAGSDREARAALQDYQFDGRRLRLKAKGSHVCDINARGVANPTFTWDVDLSLPVFDKEGRPQAKTTALSPERAAGREGVGGR